MTTWDLSHDPLTIPLGCTGKPGDAGRNRHKRRGEPVCGLCRLASNHANRERRRGAPNPRRLRPCGTNAAAARHRKRGERLDVPCQVAEAKCNAERRNRKVNEG